MQRFDVNVDWCRSLAISTVLCFASLLGCHVPVVRSPAPAAAVRATPEDAWRSLENRLLDSLPFRMRFHVASEGAVASDLRGTRVLQQGGLLEISADGQFAGQPQALLLSGNGVILRVGSQPDSLAQLVPPTLAEAVVIGLTRMGILHNLARLTGARRQTIWRAASAIGCACTVWPLGDLKYSTVAAYRASTTGLS